MSSGCGAKGLFMKNSIKLLSVGVLCGAVFGLNTTSALGAPVDAAESTAISSATTTEAIPWSKIGAKVGADYKGDGLAVTPTEHGARLRCAFQRLDGEATREGLWLTSTVTNSASERFRVVAVQ